MIWINYFHWKEKFGGIRNYNKSLIHQKRHSSQKKNKTIEIKLQQHSKWPNTASTSKPCSNHLLATVMDPRVEKLAQAANPHAPSNPKTVFSTQNLNKPFLLTLRQAIIPSPRTNVVPPSLHKPYNKPSDRWKDKIMNWNNKSFKWKAMNTLI